ncbi:MAG: hypothetical protein L0Y72_04040 [Gemmataceae bacterium]|nr:hypothetical protein [Gemmataceae bacterium]MCI0738190.1 hypothetical protein [Gemmataceae bacterium]
MSFETAQPPKLADLLANFLQKQAQAQREGLVAFDPSAEVMPYEAGPVQPIDSKLAWDETLAVAGFYGVTSGRWQTPPQWPQLVASHEPAVALAFALGNFPQLVRNFHLILTKTNLEEFKPETARPVQAQGLLEWANEVTMKKQFPQALMALGALRLAKQFDQAEALAKSLEADVPGESRAAWDNERAALRWHQGKTAEAKALWNKLPASVPVLFNRGMAELFTGNAQAARQLLADAISQIPEQSAWHHLARLYQTLAANR